MVPTLLRRLIAGGGLLLAAAGAQAFPVLPALVVAGDPASFASAQGGMDRPWPPPRPATPGVRALRSPSADPDTATIVADRFAAIDFGTSFDMLPRREPLRAGPAVRCGSASAAQDSGDPGLPAAGTGRPADDGCRSRPADHAGFAFLDGWLGLTATGPAFEAVASFLVFLCLAPLPWVFGKLPRVTRGPDRFYSVGH